MPRVENIAIRNITPEDYPSCARIYADAWNGVMPHAQRSIKAYEFEEETKEDTAFLATAGDLICGYITIYVPDCFIHHLFIAPQMQGLGIGTALLGHAEQLAGKTTLSLKCQIDNIKAIAFYKSRGFRETSKRGTNKYGDWIKLIQN